MAKAKTKGVLTRAQMVKNIRERLKDEYNIELTKDQVNAVLNIEEDEVYIAMAKCLEYKYVWGKIMGIEKPPIRVGGSYRELEIVKERGGWSNYRIGYPSVKWSKAAKVCENHHPREYFELPEHRYTSKARCFRKDSNLPEIPEYADLPEEKIKEMCKKADEFELSKLSRNERYNLERDAKFNLEKKKASINYWEKTGYIPSGVIYEEALGDENYTGKQRDTIDIYLEKHIFKKEGTDEEPTLAEKYEIVLNAEEIAIVKNLWEEHKEIQEYKKKYKQEMDEKGIAPIPHKELIIDSNSFTLKYKGEEDPWDLQKQFKARGERNKKILHDFKKKLAEETNATQEDIDLLPEAYK